MNCHMGQQADNGMACPGEESRFRLKRGLVLLAMACISLPTQAAKPRPADPSPAQLIAGSEQLPGPYRRLLVQRYFDAYDADKGGLKLERKYLDCDSVEYAMSRAHVGDEAAALRVKQTLASALSLLDPTWGGFYRYSSGGDWNAPNFEKTLRVQADSMRLYALAYLQTQDEQHLKAARRTRDYLRDFLTSPEGAFYSHQAATNTAGMDAAAYFALDDVGRRGIGLPVIDRHRYTVENGLAIEALLSLYRAEHNPSDLQAALRAVRWIMANRSLPGGGFRHGDRDSGGPLLADNVVMGSALLSLYHVTADRSWLQQATQTGHFIIGRFRNREAGFNRSAPIRGIAPARPSLEENIRMTRFLNLLGHYSGDREFFKQALHGMRYLSRAEVVKSAFEESGILLADNALARDPLHVTVVGSKKDPAAAALFAAALAHPGSYQRIEWWDRDEGLLPNADVEYPHSWQAAAFVCVNKTCSAPALDPGQLRRLLQDPANQG